MKSPFGFLKKEERPESPRKQHADMVSERARLLIGELVKDVPEPNHQLINELLDLLASTASMPSNLINREAVLQNSKQLLIQLVEPIPEPNHKLINELIQLIGYTVTHDMDNAIQPAKMMPAQAASTQNMAAQPVQNPAQQSPSQNPVPAQNAIQPDSQKSAQQSQQPKVDEGKKAENQSIMNLILEQIKELIDITNNLNDKLKKQETRIDGNEAIINKIKEKVDSMDSRMVSFEKNIEKFIGLYEVVTNQYNPFVETAEDSGMKQPVKPIELKSDNRPDPTAYHFKTNDGKEIRNLYELLDELISMDNSTFIFHVGQGRNDFAEWVRDVQKQKELADELFRLSTKSDMVKAIMKKLNS